MAHLSYKSITFAITNRSHKFWEQIVMGADQEGIGRGSGGYQEPIKEIT